MKIFRIVSNIIVSAVMAVGLILCVIPYVDHSLNCHGCSAHNIHPIVEMVLYSFIALFALAIFGVSRLILRLWDKKANPVQAEERKKAKLENSARKWGEKTVPEKLSIILPLAVILLGLIHCTVIFITELHVFYIEGHIAAWVYMYPYVLIALAVFAVCRLINRLTINKPKSGGEGNSVIFVLAFMAAGFLHSFCMFIGDLIECFTINGSFDDTVFQFVYLIPYSLIAAAVFGIGRWKAERVYKTEL